MCCKNTNPLLIVVIVKSYLLRIAGISCCFLASTAHAGEPCSFWVWNRRDALGAEEKQALTQIQAALYWHIGELDLSDATPSWRWKDRLPEPGAIPVVRLNPGGTAPFHNQQIAVNLARLADNRGRLQIDCDCPDRLLGDYARLLGEIHKRVPHLSATALAGWSSLPAFGELQQNVEELDVMFYDLKPDASNVSPENLPSSLLDEKIFAAQLDSWNGSKVPWRAGLPNFGRVTLFDSTGHSLGQIRNWAWDDVIFQPRLKFVSASVPGVVMLKADGDLVVANTPVKSGAYIVMRWVDKKTLSDALEMVGKSKSAGPIIFRLPDSTDPSGWSIPQLTELLAGRPGESKFHLRFSGNTLTLENNSQFDLPPRLLSDTARGYELEVDAPIQLWREAIAGEFWRVGSHANPETAPVPVPVPLCTRLTFWFGSLRAGRSLQSGLIQLAPGADIHQIRYRILPGDQSWKPLE